jgi:hypothetical protein
MNLPDPALAALIGASVAGLFSILGFLLVRSKEQSTRKEEAALKFLQRQIEELYGPLAGLLQRTATVHAVAHARLFRDGRFDWESLTDEEKQLWRFLNTHYLIPTNDEILELVNTKSFLFEGEVAPPVVQQFRTHALQYKLINTIWDHTGLDAKFIDHVRFPKDLPTYVENTLRALRAQHEFYLRKVTRVPVDAGRLRKAANDKQSRPLA